MRALLSLLALVTLVVVPAAAQNVTQKPQARPMRVAVVNVGPIFERYEAARAIKADLKTLKESRELSKKSADNVVAVWKDIQETVAKYAVNNDIDLVFGYTDPLNKDELDLFPNVYRKMQAMDIGGTVPLAVTGRVDISKAILDRLNGHDWDAEDKKPAEALGGSDRVAVVNIAQVFCQFKKALKFQNELETALVPAKKLTDDIRIWEQTIRDHDFDDETKGQLNAKISKAKKRLEEMSAEMRRSLGKKQEDNLVELWRDFQEGVKTYADRHGIDLVLGYGDPLDERSLDQFPNINRKMTAMDQGSSLPFSVASRKLDIADGIVDLLNNPDGEPQKSKIKIPAVRVSAINIGQVFHNYDHAQKLRKELDEEAAPFKKKAARLTKDGRKVELEELEAEIRRALGKKMEGNLVTLWKEVHRGAKAIAKEQGTDIVFGFAEWPDNALLNQFSNVKRHLQALDVGGAVSLFVAPRADVSEPVVQLVNRWVRDAEKKNSSKAPKDDSKQAVPAPTEEKTWVGKTILITKAGIKIGHSADDGEQVYVATLLKADYVVLAEDSGWIKVNDGRGNVGWFDKADAVLLEDAAIYFSTRITKNPRDSVAYAGRGYARLLLGDLDEALKDLDHALRIKPDADLYGARGAVWIRKKDYDKAMADFTAAIRLKADHISYANRSWVWTAKGEFDKALADLNEALRLEPKLALALSNRGAVWAEKGQLDKAMADLDEAIRLDPTDAKPFGNRGNVWTAKGDHDKAIADYTQAIKLRPKHPDAHYNRGCAWFEKGEHEKAIADLTEVIRLEPTGTDGYYTRANMWCKKGDYDKAIADYTEVIKRDPKAANAHYNRGTTWATKKDYDKAIADFSEVIRLEPKSGDAFMNRAIAWQRKKDYAKAIADADAARKLDPKDAAPVHMMAWIMATAPDAKVRDGKRAVELAKKAVEIDPKNVHHLDALAAAHAEAGNFEQAIHWQERANKVVPAVFQDNSDRQRTLELYRNKLPLRQD